MEKGGRGREEEREGRERFEFLLINAMSTVLMTSRILLIGLGAGEEVLKDMEDCLEDESRLKREEESVDALESFRTHPLHQGLQHTKGFHQSLKVCRVQKK